MKDDADMHPSRRVLAAIAATFALSLGGVLMWQVRDGATARSSGDRIAVVSAPVEVADHGAESNGDPAVPLPVTLDAAEANQLVTRNLPMLREVRSTCDAEACSVSAEPSAAGQPLDEQAFSQLLQEDMPTILARTGHGLLEPIQIEEIGPDQHRLRFRIARQSR